MRLLILRPQPGADATAARVRAAGHEPLMMPLFAVEPVDWDAPAAATYDNLLFTSANAVRQAGANLALYRDLPVYAVGQNTADAARQAGFDIAVIGDAGIDAVLDKLSDRRLLWLTGEDHIEPAAHPSVGLHRHIVYRSVAVILPAGFADTARSADHVLLHSPRAARHFGELLGQSCVERSAISIAVLSPNIAEAAGSGWKSVRVAPQPNDAALLSQL
jgi:uroporphyrinogen-III synthase